MTKTEIRHELESLPLDEQLELADEVMQRATPEEGFILSDDDKRMLVARRDQAIAHPERGVPYEEVRARLFKGL